jgi:hypothetical protein
MVRAQATYFQVLKVSEWLHETFLSLWDHAGDRRDGHIPWRLEKERNRHPKLVTTVDHPMVCRLVCVRSQRIHNVTDVDD